MYDRSSDVGKARFITARRKPTNAEVMRRAARNAVATRVAALRALPEPEPEPPAPEPAPAPAPTPAPPSPPPRASRKPSRCLVCLLRPFVRAYSGAKVLPSTRKRQPAGPAFGNITGILLTSSSAKASTRKAAATRTIARALRPHLRRRRRSKAASVLARAWRAYVRLRAATPCYHYATAAI